MTNYGNDKAEFSKAIKKVLFDCSLNSIFTEEFIGRMSYFDTEFLYLALRARSVGEVQEVEYVCNNIPEGETEPCGTKVMVPVDFTKMEFEVPEGHTRSIELTDQVVLNMNYPSFEYLEDYSKKIGQEGLPPDDMFDISLEYLAGLIDTVFTPDGVIKANDFTKEEAVEWLENLTEDNFLRIQQGYLNKSPKIAIKTHFHCKKCGWEQDISLEGLESFFD